MTRPLPDRFWEHPDLHLHDIDLARRELIFVTINRDALRELAFHKDNLIPTGRARYVLPVHEALQLSVHPEFVEAAEIPTRPTHYLFHTSFCGSTLLSRALETAAGMFAIREPLIMTRLVELRRTLPNDAPETYAQWKQLLHFALRALATQANLGEPTLLKGLNMAILPELFDLLPEARAVFLYHDLGSHIRQVIKRPSRVTTRRQWIADWSSMETVPTLRPNVLPQTDAATLRDEQVAALVWLWRRQQWVAAVNGGIADRAVGLEAKTFFADQGAVLEKAAAFYGVGVSAETIRSTLNSSVFQQHSKTELSNSRLASTLAKTGLYWKIPAAIRRRGYANLMQQRNTDRAGTEVENSVQAGVQWANEVAKIDATPTL